MFFKLLVVGESGVGKTCLLLRFVVRSKFDALLPLSVSLLSHSCHFLSFFFSNRMISSATFISLQSVLISFVLPSFDFRLLYSVMLYSIQQRIKTVTVDDRPVKLQIWDTAGQERFRTLTESYYRNSQGVILVYDVTNRESFEKIRSWASQIDKYGDLSLCKLLVGNKIDKANERTVTPDEGKRLAKSLGIPFIETSAKHTNNVEEAFMKLASEIYGKIQFVFIVTHSCLMFTVLFTCCSCCSVLFVCTDVVRCLLNRVPTMEQ